MAEITYARRGQLIGILLKIDIGIGKAKQPRHAFRQTALLGRNGQSVRSGRRLTNLRRRADLYTEDCGKSDQRNRNCRCSDTHYTNTKTTRYTTSLCR